MGPCKILVVDDDADDREIISTAFREAGINNFVAFSSAQAALGFLESITLQEYLPKMIITDLNLPAVSGYDLLQSLKSIQHFKHIPVIICSTSNRKEDVSKCLAKGAFEYFTKPTTLSEYFAWAKRVKQLAAS